MAELWRNRDSLSGMTRISHLFTALALLAVVAAACGGASSETTTTAGDVRETTTTSVVTPTTAETTSTTAEGTTSAPPTTPSTSSTSSTSTTVAPTTEDPAARITVIAVEVANGAVVDGQEEYEVARDAVVEIIVTADVSDEVHVHGYDEFADVAPGEAGTLTFVASIPGIFEVEFEGSGLLLFDLVVS